MSAAVFYCHACLDDMGLRRNGIRNHKRPKANEAIGGQCPCCREPKQLFDIRDYQRKKQSYAPNYQARKLRERQHHVVD
jgi:hypothetical protein